MKKQVEWGSLAGMEDELIGCVQGVSKSVVAHRRGNVHFHAFDNKTGSHLMKLIAGQSDGNKRRCFFTQYILKTGC